MDTCTCIMHGREIEPSIYGGSHGYGEYINLVFLLYIKDFFEAFISFTVTQWIRCWQGTQSTTPTQHLFVHVQVEREREPR